MSRLLEVIFSRTFSLDDRGDGLDGEEVDLGDGQTLDPLEMPVLQLLSRHAVDVASGVLGAVPEARAVRADRPRDQGHPRGVVNRLNRLEEK